MQQRRGIANGHIEQDHTEAVAALRKALGLERLLGRLRSERDVPAAPRRRPRPRRTPVSIQDHAHAAA